MAVALSPSILAASGDAGTSADAGDTRDTATLLPSLGGYEAGYSPSDVDWFKANASSSTPRCATYVVTGVASALALEHESNGVVRRASTESTAAGDSFVSIAAPSGGTLYASVDPIPSGSGSYAFTLSQSGIPASSSGDALTGADAGSSLSNAIAVGAGCIGGRLSTLNNIADASDFFSLNLPQGQQMTYSFAQQASSTPLTLRLLDATGAVVGGPIASGGMLSFTPPQTGTYFLTVTSSSSTLDDTGYLIGVVIGPPDPGSGCRPQC